MDWVTAIQNKLDVMRQYCIDQSAIDCDVADVSNSQAAYNAQFDALELAISNYRSDTSNRESQLRDIIVFDFAYGLVKDYNFTPAINLHSPPYPTGYSDYWELFKMNSMVDTILGYADSYYYQGCIISPTGTTPNLQTDITAIGTAETADSNNRQALITWLQGYPQSNALIQLTENQTVTGTPATKEVIGASIYTTKGAAEIINAFSLNVYIPSYI
jgi:hypothetical protein